MYVKLKIFISLQEARIVRPKKLGYIHAIPSTKAIQMIGRTPIRYVTLYFRDQRRAALLRYRNRTEITVFMCEQKLYPVLGVFVALTLVPRSLLIDRTETLATQARVFVPAQKLSVVV